MSNILITADITAYVNGAYDRDLWKQIRFKFPNGYGASVIRSDFGFFDGMYELAVLDSAGELTYSTPITDDVERFDSWDDVVSTLYAIMALK